MPESLPTVRRPAPVILVAGTWGLSNLEEPWWRTGSAFSKFLELQGIELLNKFSPFYWTTDLDGVDRFNDDWFVAGRNLIDYAHARHPPLQPGQYRPVSIIAHSHGGHPPIIGAAFGLLIDVLITIATPVRRDMLQYADAARPNIRRWIHLYTDDSDWWQRLGSLFGGNNTFRRTMPQADENVFEKGVGHSGLLRPALWEHREWVKFLL